MWEMFANAWITAFTALIIPVELLITWMVHRICRNENLINILVAVRARENEAF